MVMWDRTGKAEWFSTGHYCKFDLALLDMDAGTLDMRMLAYAMLTYAMRMLTYAMRIRLPRMHLTRYGCRHLIYDVYI
jgi:hypothetical protein